MSKIESIAVGQGGDVRNRILETASELFYKQGVRAVGVDLVVEKAGVAKTSLYRHFGTKDDLVAAFLEREDHDFWGQWDSVAVQHQDNAKAELEAHMGWIGERVGRPHYRGCPQINVAAEFPEADHPARKIAEAHKREMRRRLRLIVERLHVGAPDEIAGQLAVLINGAFVSSQIFAPGEATPLLRRAAEALISAGEGSRRGRADGSNSAPSERPPTSGRRMRPL
ncbi:TetR/AcrR family transcriptional regulator [Sinorhizobium saheli]|uniref:TetR/AcrR family transcriptional regulator n=1 Tax=Sinorhizobium saheli TaxID=36856 RepID=UPI0009FD024E|nr:TetR/AcrR family transcriptional regulator [Sinorhizobium saheli]MQW88234.1 TetR family transcriptional regulator [Sinorhizobium saheli]